MGVIKQGILGGFSGKVANVVGSSWKGIAVIKSLPLSVANPRTALQVSNRTGFSVIVAFASTLLVDVLKPLLDRVAVQMSGFNLFVKNNRDYFDETGIIAPASVSISNGVLTSPVIQDFAPDTAANEVELTFVNNTGVGDALASDELYGFLWNETTNEFRVYTTHYARSSTSFDVITGFNVSTNDVLHVWFAYRRADGSRASDTTYMSVVAA